MSHFPPEDDDTISGINITPLVDVFLVLLIIFMMTAPMIYQASLKIHLPQAKSGEMTEKTALNFSISRTGELALDNKPIDWESLKNQLGTLGDQMDKKTAVISADRETPHGTVIRLMDSLRQEGLTHFAINVAVAKSVTNAPKHP